MWREVVRARRPAGARDASALRLVRRAAGTAGRACRRSAPLGRRARLNGEATRARGGAHARARTPRYRIHAPVQLAAREIARGAYGREPRRRSGDPPRTGHRWERNETADGYGASARRSSPTARPSASVVFPRLAVVADTDVTRRGSGQDPRYRRTRHIWSPRSRLQNPSPSRSRKRCAPLSGPPAPSARSADFYGAGSGRLPGCGGAPAGVASYAHPKEVLDGAHHHALGPVLGDRRHAVAVRPAVR